MTAIRTKGHEIKLRVTPQMKALVQAAARQRGEGESVIVREALTYYFAARPAAASAIEQKPTKKDGGSQQPEERPMHPPFNLG